LSYIDAGAYLEEEWPKIEVALDFEADEGNEDDWLFDSTRDPAEQARILREYKP